MKTKILVLTTLLIFLMTSIYKVHGQKNHDRKEPDKRTEILVKKLTELLKLSKDQTGKVKEIIMLREKQRDKDFEKFQKNEEALKKAKRERNKTANESLKNILTEQQFKDLRKWRQKIADAKKEKTPEKAGKEDNEQLIRELEAD